MALSFNLRVGESLKIDGPSTVTLREKTGQRVTVLVETERNVAVQKIDNPISPVVARRGISGR